MKILMVTIGYLPYAIGGTETYVSGLIESLKKKGHTSYVTYLETFDEPNGESTRVRTYEYLDTRVYQIGVNTALHKLESVIFDSDLQTLLIEEFRKIANLVNPEIIHVHPLQLGLESHLIEAFNKENRNVVLTYHSTNTSCARGDMIYMGKEVCDGLLIKERCTHCLLNWKGVPVPVAVAMAKIPPSWYKSAFNGLKPFPAMKKLRSVMSIGATVDERFRLWKRATTNAKAIVAVCEWVKNTIAKNGIPEEKIVFSRHGLRLVPEYKPVDHSGKVLFGYLGRISPEKGIQSLIDALKKIPSSFEFEFEFCSWTFQDSKARPDEKVLMGQIYELESRDKRIRVLRDVDDNDLSSVSAKWDAIVVPSFWLESGPEVIYEALAVKTPVIGSRRGGIAELVQEGKTGFLYTPCDVDELVALMEKFATDASSLRAMRANIPPVRTTDQVADDMEKLYNRLIAKSIVSYAV